jgi:hypothetical protein
MCIFGSDKKPSGGNTGSGTTPAGSTCSNCDAKNVTITLISLEFTTDHGLLTDQFSTSTDSNETGKDLDRWAPGGTKFQDKDPKEWTPKHSFPISHTKSKTIEVIAEYEVTPPNAKTTSGFVVLLNAEGPVLEHLRFLSTGVIQFPPTDAAKSNTVKVRMKAAAPLPDKIHKINTNFRSRVSAGGREFFAFSGRHIIYVTFDTPKAENDQTDFDPRTHKPLPPIPEPLGITLKRMDKSVELVEPIDKPAGIEIDVTQIDVPGSISTPPTTKNVKTKLDRPHTIAQGLMRLFPFYQLNPDKDLAIFDHPKYFNQGFGGAWPMADYRPRRTGECQAIVRFVSDVLRQLGVPGKAETVFVFAKTSKPFDATENTTGNRYRTVALVDQEVTEADVGKLFPPNHTRMKNGISIGFNNFEACLRFTHDGVQIYYGGGAGAYKDKDAVITAFHALVELIEVPTATFKDENGKTVTGGFKITKILRKYR